MYNILFIDYLAYLFSYPLNTYYLSLSLSTIVIFNFMHTSRILVPLIKILCKKKKRKHFTNTIKTVLIISNHE